MVLFLPLLGAASVAGAGATCVYLGFQTGFPPSSNGPAMADIAALKPVFFPAAASICLLYVFLMAQSASAFAAHRKLKSQSALRGDKAPSLGEVKYGGKAVGVLMMDRVLIMGRGTQSVDRVAWRLIPSRLNGENRLSSPRVPAMIGG